MALLKVASVIKKRREYYIDMNVTPASGVFHLSSKSIVGSSSLVSSSGGSSAQVPLCVCLFLKRMCRDSISDVFYGFELLFLTTLGFVIYLFSFYR